MHCCINVSDQSRLLSGLQSAAECKHMSFFHPCHFLTSEQSPDCHHRVPVGQLMWDKPAEIEKRDQHSWWSWLAAAFDALVELFLMSAKLIHDRRDQEEFANCEVAHDHPKAFVCVCISGTADVSDRHCSTCQTRRKNSPEHSFNSKPSNAN